jgi:hypothetical protein
MPAESKTGLSGHTTPTSRSDGLKRGRTKPDVCQEKKNLINRLYKPARIVFFRGQQNRIGDRSGKSPSALCFRTGVAHHPSLSQGRIPASLPQEPPPLVAVVVSGTQALRICDSQLHGDLQPYPSGGLRLSRILPPSRRPIAAGWGPPCQKRLAPGSRAGPNRSRSATNPWWPL